MDSTKLLRGYAGKLEEADKALTTVVRRAEKLADQRDRTEAQRGELEAQIETTEQTLTELRAEDETLKAELLDSMMEDDTVKQRELKQRRKSVADTIRDGESEIEQLTASLEQLPDLDRDAAALAVELDRLKTGDWYGFVEEMRKALRTSAAALDSKRNEARKNLPKFDSGTYESIRLEEDEQYRKAKEHQEWQENQLQARLERNRQNLADAQKQHVGTGDRGSRRAATIGDATRKIRESRRGGWVELDR